MAFLVAQMIKESACNVEDLGSIPGSGRSSGEGSCYPLQYSCLENSMDRGAWRATVHGVTKSRTGLNKNDNSIFIITVLRNTAREQSCFEFNLLFFSFCPFTSRSNSDSRCGIIYSYAEMDFFFLVTCCVK